MVSLGSRKSDLFWSPKSLQPQISSYVAGFVVRYIELNSFAEAIIDAPSAKVRVCFRLSSSKRP